MAEWISGDWFSCESLLGVLQNLVARIPRDGTLVSIYSGVAATDYFGGELGRYIRPYFPDVTMRFEDDAVNLISGPWDTRTAAVSSAELAHPSTPGLEKGLFI